MCVNNTGKYHTHTPTLCHIGQSKLRKVGKQKRVGPTKVAGHFSLLPTFLFIFSLFFSLFPFKNQKPPLLLLQSFQIALLERDL